MCSVSSTESFTVLVWPSSTYCSVVFGELQFGNPSSDSRGLLPTLSSLAIVRPLLRSSDSISHLINCMKERKHSLLSRKREVLKPSLNKHPLSIAVEPRMYLSKSTTPLPGLHELHSIAPHLFPDCITTHVFC